MHVVPNSCMSDKIIGVASALMGSILCYMTIRESVDSLCRDGADTPIVRVHRKAFLTRKKDVGMGLLV